MADTPPPEIGLDKNQQIGIIVSMTVLIAIPTLFVFARLVSRKLAHAGFWYDDFLIVLGCITCYFLFACIIIAEQRNDYGTLSWARKHEPKKYSEFIKILFIFELGWFVTTTIIKLAILAFYRRIFPVREMRLPLWIAFGMVICYFVGSFTAAVFQCIPVHRLWSVSGPGHCSKVEYVQVVPGIINCVTDFLILILPIPLLWRLRTTTSQKGVLTSTFTCASFVVVVSIIRIVQISRLNPFDPHGSYVKASVWSTAEPCMGVVSACLPSLRPLMSMLFRGKTTTLGIKRGSTGSGYGSSSGISSRMPWRNRTEDNDSMGHFERLTDPIVDRPGYGYNVSVRGRRGGDGASNGEDISLKDLNVPVGGILVTEEVIITSSDWIDYNDKVF